MNQTNATPTVPAEKPAIVFDFGGVLVDWNPYYLYRKLFSDDAEIETFLDEIGFFEWNQLQDAGRSFDEAVDELCARHPERCAMIRAYHQRYEESLGGAIWPTVKVLRALKAAGYSLYGLSNWPAEKFRQVRHKFPFFELFDDLVISGEVLLAKPDPRIFELLLERVGRPAGECLFIDDSPTNIAVAASLGFQTILFHSAEELQQELERILQ